MVQCIYHVCLGAYQFWFDDNVEQCLTTIEQGLSLSKSFGLNHWDVPMLNVALYLCCSCELLPLAEKYLKRLHQCLNDESRPHDFAIYYHFKAYVTWLKGELNEALFAAEKALKISKQTGFSFSPLYYELGVIQILSDLKRYDEALSKVLTVSKLAECYNSLNLQLMALMIQVNLLIQIEQNQEAELVIKKLMLLAKKSHIQHLPWIKQKNIQAIEALYEYDSKRLESCLFLSQCTEKQKKIKIHTLGCFYIEGLKEARKPSKILYSLLMLLIAAGSNGISQYTLMQSIWPNIDFDLTKNRLKTNLHRLRKLLGQKNTIIQKQTTLTLNQHAFEIDCWQFIDLTQEGANIESLKKAIALYKGGFDTLAFAMNELQVFKIYLEKCFNQAVLTLNSRYLDQKDINASYHLIYKAWETDEVNEEFCKQLIKLLSLTGRKEEIPSMLNRFAIHYQEILSIPVPKEIIQTAQTVLSSR